MRYWFIFILCTIFQVGMAQSLYEYHYWFDNDTQNSQSGQTNSADVHIDIDTSPLQSGLHTFNYQIVNSDKGESIVKSSLFYKTPTYKKQNTIVFIDGKQSENLSSSQSVQSSLHLDVNVDSLSLGLHTVGVQLVDDGGSTSSTMETYFMRIPSSKEIDSMSMYYYIDNNKAIKEKCSMLNNVAHADLDLASLQDGLHTITFLLGNDNGLTTQFASAYFIKEPLGGNGIVSYQYWVNSNKDDAFTKSFEMPQSTAHIVDILDLPHYPLQSSSFTFAIEDAKPVIYPCNSFNIMFEDASGRFLSSHKDYTDVTMRTPIDDSAFKTLKTGTRELAENVSDNNIAWYKFDGKEGDSISIRADKSCSIDVFTPTGEVLKQYEGYASVNSDGFFIFENGTYYVAVHDSKSSYTKNIALDFYQLAKYAIVDYDVSTVGNGGLTTITFNGNGYYSLNSIDLVKGDNVISAFDIKRLSNTKLEATFDFSNKEKGKYDINFAFLDDNVSVSKGIEVEDASEITIDHKVDYESVFYIGHEPYYNITVTNNGNNTAYDVPIYIYVETKLSDGMPRIRVSGLNLESAIADVDTTGFSLDERSKLEDLSKQIGNNFDFMRMRSLDEESGDSVLLSAGYFFANIAPHSTKKITVSIAATDTTECYVTIPDEWMAFATTQQSKKARSRANGYGDYVKDVFCCYHDKVDCVADLVAHWSEVTSFVSTLCAQFGIAKAADIVGCVASLASNISLTATAMFCSEEAAKGEKDLYEKLQIASEGLSIAGFLKDCALRFCGGIEDITETLKFLNKINECKMLFDHVDVNVSCVKSFFSKKPNCPPIPPDGGKSDPINSYDPNDILGYLSQSGTHYVGINQDKLNYTIEFENDSTLATAAAHKIILNDKLDPTIFDVSSIHTSKVIIGGQELSLDVNGEFVSTIDMRPAINAIAEVKLSLDQQTGEAKYEITSLDPLTVEPTNDVMAGILPVNNANGDGQGYVVFDVKLKDNLADGTLIDNKASITFDMNEAIETPTWSNETDYVLPTSYVSGIDIIDDSNINIKFDGIDTRSGIWKYDLYYQPGEGSAWFLVAEDLKTQSYSMEVFNDINYGFCVIATDKAGNKEVKETSQEYSYMNGDVFSSIKEISIDELSTKNRKVYDLQGRRVKGSLTPGIYIIKGQKFLVR